MISSKKRHVVQAALSILCTVTVTSVSTSIYAAPTSDELENKTSALQNELSDLNSELTSLSQELGDISSQIESMAAEVETAKLDLAAATLNENAQYDSMKDRIKFMYEGGNVSLLNILFSSDSMADFLNKAEYVTTISEYDREMLDELKAVRIDVEEKQSELESRQTELSSLQEQLTEKQSALNSKISSTSGELANYKEQLEKAKAAEAALKNAQNNNISGPVGNTQPTPGGAVETPDKFVASPSDTALLAAVLECECGASYEGMLAVGTVIMNRVASSRFPNTISGVIYQKGQFYPAGSGVLNKVLSRGPSASAYAAAQALLSGTRHSAVSGCYFFYAAWYAEQRGVSGVNVGGNVFF